MIVLWRDCPDRVGWCSHISGLTFTALRLWSNGDPEADCRERLAEQIAIYTRCNSSAIYMQLS